MKRLALVIVCLLVACGPLEAAVTFRSFFNDGGGVSTNLTATEPPGTANGDILIALFYRESASAPTQPSGWSTSFNGTTVSAVLTAETWRFDASWIRRGASAPDLTWVFSSSGRQLVILAYSGALASGDPFSFGTSAVKDNTVGGAFPTVSGTTADANEMLVWGGGDFNGGTSTPPTGFTARVSATVEDLNAAELLQVSAGATGSVSGASTTAAGTTGAVMFGLRPAAGGGPTCTPTLSLMGVGRCG